MNCVTEMEYIRGYLKTLLQYYMYILLLLYFNRDIIGKYNKYSLQQFLPLLNQNPIKIYDYCVAIKALCDVKIKYEQPQPPPQYK